MADDVVPFSPRKPVTQRDIDDATDELLKELRVGKGFKPMTPECSAYRLKDIEIHGDAKFREMKDFLGAHEFQERMLARSSNSEDEVGKVDKLVRQLADSAKVKPSPRSGATYLNSPRFHLAGQKITGASSSAAAAPVSPRSIAQVAIDGRIAWREEMDRNLKRLLDDMELGRNPNLDRHSHRMVCEQFEKRYGWFEQSGQKDVAKEKKGYAFVGFDPSKPAMPGSTRALGPRKRQ